ncbi:unnamed protein product, partial [Owenia fusiformis]
GTECKTSADCKDANRAHCLPDGLCHECRAHTDCDEKYPICSKNSEYINVCGDPRVQQTIKGTDLKFCYKIFGEPGETYLYLKDRDLAIYASFKQIYHEANVAQFIGKLSIKKGNTWIHITPGWIHVKDGLKAKEKKYNIRHHNTIKLSVGRISKWRPIDIYLDNDNTVIAVRPVGYIFEGKPHWYLNFGISEYVGMSNSADGIMGSITHKAAFKPTKGKNGVVTWLDQKLHVHRDGAVCWKVIDRDEKHFLKALHIFKRDLSHLDKSNKHV